MNKKRYLIIIAIAVFVFLALFTFANPFEKEEKPNDNKEIEEIEKEEQEEIEEKEEQEEQPVVVVPDYPIYNNHGVTQKPQITIDSSYDEALKAVINAEETLSLESLTEATKLVEKVKDEVKKEALEERLEVITEILSLTEDIDTLVNKVNTAANKVDMDSARKFANEADITNRLNATSNEVIKNLLSEKLESIAKKVNDIKVPEVNIEDEAVLTVDTKITVTDESEVIIKLNDEEIENNTLVSEGKYTLVVTDESFNSTEITFVIDTNAPAATVTFANGITYITVEDVTEVAFNVYKEDELKNTYKSEEIGKTLELATDSLDAGQYVVKVLDELGNETLVDVYVAEDLKSALTYTDEVTLHGDVELPIDEPLIITAGQNKVINLNGNKITGKSTVASTSNLIQVKNGASLRLEGEGEVSFLATSPDTDWVAGFPGYANNTIVNSGKLVIDGPSVINNTPKGGASYAIDNYPGADLEVISGSIINAGGGVAIRMFANSETITTKVTISGGTISGCRGIWLQLPGSNPASAKLADLIITGGTFTILDTTADNAIYSYSYGDSFANTNIIISGGTFNGDVGFGGGYKGDKENVTITGGTFNGEVGRYLSGGGWEPLQ